MKVSIITCSFNSKSTIKNSLDSVAFQSWQNIEHVIIDGKSTDGTLDIIKSYNNTKIKCKSEADFGIYDAMNKGINLATGDIIGTLNSDDRLYHENVISEIVEIFESDSEIMCLYGNVIFINSNGNIVRNWISSQFVTGLFEKSWTPAHPTFYCKRSVFENFGVYKTDYYIAADVELMFRLLEIHKLKSFYFNSVLVEMLIGGRSTKNLMSTIIISREMLRVFHDNGRKLNFIKYVFHKFKKVSQFKLKYFLNFRFF